MKCSSIAFGLAVWLGLSGAVAWADPTPSTGIDQQIAALLSNKMRLLGFEKAPASVERKEARVLQPSGTRAAKEAEEKAVSLRCTIEWRKLVARWYLLGDSDVLGLTALSALKDIVAAAETVGDYDACLGLAYCFANGVEMPMDHKQAQTWFDEADRLLRKHYRSLMTGTERDSQQDESTYVKHEVDLTMAALKHRNFGLLEGFRLDCAGSPCHGCEKKMVEDDRILVIKLVTSEGWRLFIGHQTCHQAMMWRLKITSLDCTCGHAMNKETRRERMALFGFGASASRS